MTDAIEAQVERFAPGFRDRDPRAPRRWAPARIEAHDANYIGGDINGGVGDLRQFFARPRARRCTRGPRRSPALYLCSSSTPPGGGVHGMCGWHAAHEVLRTTT